MEAHLPQRLAVRSMDPCRVRQRVPSQMPWLTVLIGRYGRRVISMVGMKSW